MSHLADRPAARRTEAVARMAQRYERRNLDVRRDGEERLEILLEGPVQRGERGAETEGARGQQQVLNRREDRRVGGGRRAQAAVWAGERAEARVIEAAGDHDWRLVQRGGKLAGGAHHPRIVRLVAHVAIGVGVVRVALADLPGLAVAAADLLAQGAIPPPEEDPGLPAARRRRARGRVEDPVEDGVGDGLRSEAPERALRLDDLEEVHRTGTRSDGLDDRGGALSHAAADRGETESTATPAELERRG